MYKILQGPSRFNVQSSGRRTQLDPALDTRNGKVDSGRNSVRQIALGYLAVVCTGMADKQSLFGVETQYTEQEVSAHSSAVPTFQQMQGPRQRESNMRFNNGVDNGVPESYFSPSHREIIKMLQDSWTQTERELEDYQRGRGNIKVEEFFSKDEHSYFKNFKPVDLDQLYWSQLQQPESKGS